MRASHPRARSLPTEVSIGLTQPVKLVNYSSSWSLILVVAHQKLVGVLMSALPFIRRPQVGQTLVR